MKPVRYDIEILAAPSILGLKPGGVEHLADRLLTCGLAEHLPSPYPVIPVPTLNSLYNPQRDPETHCLNAEPLRDFSLTLARAVSSTLSKGRFAVVLGGDCSILLGIMPALKERGSYGLIFLDAHADFYEPEKSVTGEVADMDLAIVTGRGPELLTNIYNLKPYVKDKHVIHIGQRDEAETQAYGSQDIRDTGIKCVNLAAIEKKGIDTIVTEVAEQVEQLAVDGYWIHFDTDVLSDAVNPAVDYRLHGGLLPEQVIRLMRSLLATGRMTGLSVTIYNPWLDSDGHIAQQITECLGAAFEGSGPGERN
jgi:arginase